MFEKPFEHMCFLLLYGHLQEVSGLKLLLQHVTILFPNVIIKPPNWFLYIRNFVQSDVRCWPIFILQLDLSLIKT